MTSGFAVYVENLFDVMLNPDPEKLGVSRITGELGDMRHMNLRFEAWKTEKFRQTCVIYHESTLVTSRIYVVKQSLR